MSIILIFILDAQCFTAAVCFNKKKSIECLKNNKSYFPDSYFCPLKKIEWNFQHFWVSAGTLQMCSHIFNIIFD
jgi:hypothetical protein